MTLDSYLSAPGHTVADLALRAGTTPASITRILYGEQKPSVDMIRAIVAATNGSITADDLIFGAPRPKTSKVRGVADCDPPAPRERAA